LRSIFVGNDVHGINIPAWLNHSVQLTETLRYPVYRLFMSAVCLVLAGGLYYLIARTKLGMTIRAGAENRDMVAALGIDIKTVFRAVFALGVALAAFAGMLAAPVSPVAPNMGNQVLIISFVVVVIGGVGSVSGALIASLLIGVVESFGSILLPEFSGALVYALMAAVLLWRPNGLLGAAK
jgi:branched-chain amino acid transport system permease protein